MYSFNRSKTVIHTTAKNDIKDLPITKMSEEFDIAYSEEMGKSKDTKLAKAKANAVVASFAETWGIKQKPWFWQQILAKIATWKLTKIGDKYDPKSLLTDNCKNDHFNKGIYRLCMYTKRSDLIKTQSSPEGLPYCSLVPLILAAFKKYKDIPYSAWNTDTLQLIVEEKLYEAMHQILDSSISTEDILAARSKGLEVKTGPQMGNLRSVKTTYMLYGVGHTCIGKLNNLAQAMYCQIWCAHPENRNKYMILDPNDWDNMPEPLVSTEVFDSLGSEEPYKTKEPITLVSDIDW